MGWQTAADLVLAAHLLFLAFVVLGGLLVFVHPRWPLVHLPAALWGAYVEISGRVCPLTWLENHLLQRAGENGYGESFIGHYLLNVIYPQGLTRELQLELAASVVLINTFVYGGWLLHRRRHRQRTERLPGRP